MSTGVVSLAARRAQTDFAGYYRLPIPQRSEVYKELRKHDALERIKLVGSFLRKHGDLMPEKQLAQLFPSVNWENAERHNTPNALVYIVPQSAICDLYGKEMYEITGKVIAEEDLYDPKFKKLAGKVALIARPENRVSGPNFIIKHELDHISHLRLPCHGMAEQAEAKYYELRPQFYKAMADANNGAVDIIGIDDFEIIGIRGNGPRMRRECSAPVLINDAASAFMQFMAYRLLFEASAVLSSFGSFVEGSAGSYETIRERIAQGGLEWAFGLEIKDVTRPITHLGFNLTAVRQTFPRDNDLVSKIDRFELSSTVFAHRIAKAVSKLSQSSSEPEALRVVARSTQILSYEELTAGSVEDAVKEVLLAQKK